MISTIIINPEIEKTIDLSSFNLGQINDINEYKLKITSCGIYSAYIVKLLQGEPLVLGFAGGLGGRFIKNYLDKNRIKSSLIYKVNEVKSRFIIDDGKEKTILIDNKTNFEPSDFNNLKHKIISNMEKISIFIVGSSFNERQEREMITQTIDFLHKKHKRYIICAEDGFIDNYLNKFPTAIVCKFEQFEEISDNIDLQNKIDIVRKYCKKHQIKLMVVIDGKNIYGITKSKVVSMNLDNSFNIDSYAIAGVIAISTKRKYEFEKTMKLVGTVANKFSLSDFPNFINRNEIDKFKSKVKINDIYANGKYELGD